MPATRRILLALVALAALSILSVNVHSQSTGASQALSSSVCILTGATASVGDCVLSALPLALLGIMLSLLLVAIAFMAGEVMNYGPLKNFYKKELWEAVKSMLIVAVIFSGLVIASAIATALAGNSSQLAGSGTSQSSALTNNLASLYTTANQAYIQPQLSSSYTAFSGLLGLSLGTELIKTLEITTWFPIPITTAVGPIGSVDFGSNVKVFQSNYIDSLTGGSPGTLISITGMYVTIVLLVFQFQSALIYIIPALALGVFLPIGLVMRAVPFIRGIGGSLIAVSIGLAIVYPALLVGFNLPITNYMYSFSSATSSLYCPFTQGLICKFWTGFSSIFDTINSVILTAASSAAGGVGLVATAPALALMFGPGNPALTSQAYATASQGFATGVIGPFNNGIFPALNFAIDNSVDQIVQVILFAFDIIIAYAITNGIASLLGGKLTLGIGKFKLA